MTFNKRGYLLFLVILAVSLVCFSGNAFFSASAANSTGYNKEKALTYLKSGINEQSSVSELVFGMLVLKENGVNINNYFSALKAKMDTSTGCFPKGNCNTLDTAFGIIALEEQGEDVKKSVEWIKGKKGFSPVIDEMNWKLQVTTNGDGKCVVYDGSKQAANKKAELVINGNEKMSLNGKLMHWASLNEMGIRFNEPIKTIIVDCGDVDEAVIVSLLKIKGNEFYIEEQVVEEEAEFVINNACYGMKDTSCSKQATFYSAWVLSGVGEEVSVLPYLEGNLVSALDYALINLAEPDETYSDWLAENQDDVTGKWEDAYSTSFAIYSLSEKGYDEEVDKAVRWLESQQGSDGAFGTSNKVINTAVALYLGLSGRSSSGGSEDSHYECVSGDCVEVDGSGYDECSEDGECSGTGDGEGSSTAMCGDGLVEGYEECDLDNDTIIEGASKNCDGLCDAYTCKCNIYPTGCQQDSDCSNGEKCDLFSKECYTVTDCFSDADCRTGENCDYSSGLCSAPGGVGEECEVDDDCGDGEECDFFTKKCVLVQTPEECFLDEDCGDGEECSDGACVPFSTVEEETDCSDGADDDRDGDVDCDDSDCANSSSCKKKSSWWVWLIVIFVILIGGGLFLYGKFAKQKPSKKGPDFFGGFGGGGGGKEERKTGSSRPQAPARGFQIFGRRSSGGSGSPTRDMELEKRLDHSIKEAEKILKSGARK